MAAFGTKKPLGDEIQQLQFPEVLASTLAEDGARPGYVEQVEDDDDNPLDLPFLEGQDIQDKYHEQKRLDGNRMAMAGVYATRMGNKRANESHCGFYKYPKPVLSQRVFANPSNGNQADIYAARNDLRGGGTGAGNCWDAYEGLHGGVLRTAQGQTYAKKLLLSRVGQFNTIASNKEAFLANQPTQESTEADVAEGLPETAGHAQMLELNALLQQIADAVRGGLPAINRYALGDLTRALKLLFRIATVANGEELGDLAVMFDELRRVNVPSLREQIQGEKEKAQSDEGLVSSGNTMVALINKTDQYIREMLANVNKQPQVRTRISAALIRKLGFTKLGSLGKDIEPAPAPRVRGAPPAADDDAADAAPEEAEPNVAEVNEVQFAGGNDEYVDALLNQVGLFPKPRLALVALANHLHVPSAGLAQATVLEAVRNALLAFQAPVLVFVGNTAGSGQNGKGHVLGQAPLDELPPLMTRGVANQRIAALGLAQPPVPGADVEGDEMPDLEGNGQYHGRGESRQRQQVVPAPDASRRFSRIALPSEKEEQLDALRSQGLDANDVKFSRDQRNVYARKSGAYMGEQLPAGGDNVETYKYPQLKSGGAFSKAKMRCAPEPTFEGGLTPSALKQKLGGQSYVGFRGEAKSGRYNGTPDPMKGSGFIDDMKKEGKKLYNLGRYAINPIATSIRDAKHLYAQRYTPYDLPKERTWGEYFSGKGGKKMTRADLPKTREGFVKLADELKGHGHNIRVNSGSELKHIRQNFIKKLAL